VKSAGFPSGRTRAVGRRRRRRRRRDVVDGGSHGRGRLGWTSDRYGGQIHGVGGRRRRHAAESGTAPRRPASRAVDRAPTSSAPRHRGGTSPRMTHLAPGNVAQDVSSAALFRSIMGNFGLSAIASDRLARPALSSSPGMDAADDRDASRPRTPRLRRKGEGGRGRW
jgi:hypothetical protein